MKSITFNKKKYDVPENWAEVKFSQYKALMKLKDLDLGKVQQSGKIISILTGIPYSEINNASFAEYSELMANANAAFLNTTPKSTAVTAFTISDKTFIVNSLVDSKFKEFAWFEKFDSDFENPVDAICFKLAVMCRLQNEDLESVNFNERAALFEKELSAETVIGISGFFLQKRVLSDQRSQLFTQTHQIRDHLKTQLMKLLDKRMGGSIRLTVLQKIYLKCLLYLI